MSGGVDSSVTAYILKEQGYEVEGLSFILWEARDRRDFTTCCSLQAVRDAAKTAETIGIRHSRLDVRDAFIEKVIEPFVESYTQGLTPNPCILCNRHIKFPYLIREADEKGIDYIATGHYARTAADYRLYALRNPQNDDPSPTARRSVLLKGIDPKKDQSYFLYVLTPRQLDRLVLPLGQYTKKEVRRLASEKGLITAEKPESQEICFIEETNYFKFIDKLSPIANKEGPIIDMDGNVVGTHKGIFAYTVGQRRGIGVSSRTPLYVTRIDHVRNAVHVGPKEAAYSKELRVADLNRLVPSVEEKFRAHVKVRSTMKAEPATVILSGDKANVVFDEPQWAPAPGQSVVFYIGDMAAGGGIIL